MGYTDFHCHLDSSDFSENRSEIIDNIFLSGVTDIVSVADPYGNDSHVITEEIAGNYDNIFIMTAAHPHNASEYSPEVEKKIVKFMEHKKAIGVGEAGLDFHYNFSPPDVQKKVFKRQIEIAKDIGRPLIIHSREAEQEIIRILEETKFQLPVIFHCYTGNIIDAEEIISRGYYISISGIVTFKKAEYLRDIVKMIPVDRIFSETDSPYLSPEPFRGRTNDPTRVKIVADRIAEIKGISSEDLNIAIKQNFNSIRKSGN